MAPLVDPSIPELISFFKCRPPTQHIYAHKEFFELSSGRRTRIKPTTQILNQLRQESGLLVNFMFVTYNIRLQRNENGVIQFPFQQRWLRGEEYGFLCRHYYAYSKILRILPLSPED